MILTQAQKQYKKDYDALRKALALELKKAGNAYWQFEATAWQQHATVAMRLECSLASVLEDMGYRVADIAESGARHVAAA